MSTDGQLQRIVGANMRLQRARLGMTQAEFAKVLGITRSYAAGVERGERNLSVLTIERFARSLQLDPLELLEPARGQGRDPAQGVGQTAPEGDRGAAREPASASAEIFRFIADSPGRSRIELCESMTVPSWTIMRAVRELLRAGLIVEEPPVGRRNKSGRRPTALRIAAPLG